jgi:hypothetical protein
MTSRDQFRDHLRILLFTYFYYESMIVAHCKMAMNNRRKTK